MKKSIVLLAITVLFLGCKKTTTKNSIPHLPCQEMIVIGKDLVKIKVMREAILYLLRENCFVNNKGIVKLFISSDENGNEVWDIYSTIENNHMDSWSTVTPFFEVFQGDIVMIYPEGYKARFKAMSESDRNKIRMCNDEIIGNRVYEKTTRTDRWTNEYFGPEIETPQGMNRAYIGPDCKMQVVFDGNGNYEVEHWP